MSRPVMTQPDTMRVQVTLPRQLVADLDSHLADVDETRGQWLGRAAAWMLSVERGQEGLMTKRFSEAFQAARAEPPTTGPEPDGDRDAARNARHVAQQAEEWRQGVGREAVHETLEAIDRPVIPSAAGVVRRDR